DPEISARVTQAAREISKVVREIAHGESAPVTELVLLAAPAEARLVAARRLLDPNRLLLHHLALRHDRLTVLDPAAHRHGAVVLRDLHVSRNHGGRDGVLSLHRALGRAVRDVAEVAPRLLVDDDLEMEHVANEVILDLAHHRFEHVEALALPL